jgi:hypothetical protein
MKLITVALSVVVLLTGGNAPASEVYGEYRKMTPTIYYIPFFNLDRGYQCTPGDTRHTVRTTEKKPIGVMCKKDILNCMMQGSCVVILHKKRTMLSYRKKDGGEPLFVPTEDTECEYGRGPKNVCLEPFFTVAADLKQHFSGDVLYVPAFKGLRLPTGQVHDGFFIVRDTGGKIIGKDRFDFYTGYYQPQAEDNTFLDVGASDKSNKLYYLKVLDPRIKQKILEAHGYPKLPQ